MLGTSANINSLLTVASAKIATNQWIIEAAVKLNLLVILVIKANMPIKHQVLITL